jgi:hypothetical protein
MKTIFWAIVFLCASIASAQTGPEAGGHEIELWTGGGYSVPGGTSSTGVWNAGLRYGWVLTEPHGPGFLKGRFEYAVDAVPLFLVFQPTGATYGGGVNPLNLKWNFATRGKVVPYLEISGGTLFTTNDVPFGTSSINFTSGAALGTHLLGSRHAFSVEVRYMHISNAGLASPNPGINTVQVRLSIGKFAGGKH